jgi:hypothetical protein
LDSTGTGTRRAYSAFPIVKVMHRRSEPCRILHIVNAKGKAFISKSENNPWPQSYVN